MTRCAIRCVSISSTLQELAEATAEPLRPRFSAKFFTGGASGAAAYMPQALDADAGKVLAAGKLRVCHLCSSYHDPVYRPLTEHAVLCDQLV